MGAFVGWGQAIPQARAGEDAGKFDAGKRPTGKQVSKKLPVTPLGCCFHHFEGVAAEAAEAVGAGEEGGDALLDGDVGEGDWEIF